MTETVAHLEDRVVTIYTDGACLRNPGGAGGYAAVLLCGSHRKELAGGFRSTTNNRMEIMAAIEGLRALKQRSKVVLYSDSQYLVDAISKGWYKGWIRNGWQTKTKDHVKNIDLWKSLLAILGKHDVTFKWTRGHAGTAENELCDVLAGKAARGENLPVDSGFESSSANRARAFFDSDLPS